MDLLDSDLLDLIPGWLRDNPDIINICDAIQPELDEIIEIIKNKILFTHLETLDDLTLDYLLVDCNMANSIEIAFINTREDKIRFISNYIKLKKLKGTKAGVLYALEILGLKAEISEWFEYGDKPYWFKVDIFNLDVVSQERIGLIRSFITEYKNTRSWFKTYIHNTYLSNIYALPVLRRRVKYKSKAEFITAIESNIFTRPIMKRKIKFIGI